MWTKFLNWLFPIIDDELFPNGLPKDSLITSKVKKKKQPLSIFSTDLISGITPHKAYEYAASRTFREGAPIAVTEGATMDSALGSKFNLGGSNPFISPSQITYYSYQGFIGYQTAALLSQHWLISKACVMPAQDAVRNGYEITVNDGSEISLEILDRVRQLDVEYKVTDNLVEFVNLGRVFGIRIVLFKVESEDPEYYFKPFNPDGITPGSYKGMVQIDPYWITPELDSAAAADPAYVDFYEPTWWRVNAKRIHKSHLIIMRIGEVPDILKPTYFYGGIPIPQKIYERVYAAERTANEAPLLALTKRTIVRKIDVNQAIMKQADFTRRMQTTAELHNNYGTQFIGLGEEAQQFDTALTDLDNVIMTQYQLVAAACNVPAVKLLGTTPKGFNATGEYEEASYHEELESIQKHVLTPLLERHHLLLIRSEISPGAPFSTTIKWNPCDSPTAKEVQEANRLKAETGTFLIQTGAISPEEERKRIIDDPTSGYSGLTEDIVGNTLIEEPDLLIDPTTNV